MTSALGLAAEFEAEADYYTKRAVQEEAALGPGFYPELLRDMATQRARWAATIRANNSGGAT